MDDGEPPDPMPLRHRRDRFAIASRMIATIRSSVNRPFRIAPSESGSQSLNLSMVRKSGGGSGARCPRLPASGAAAVVPPSAAVYLHLIISCESTISDSAERPTVPETATFSVIIPNYNYADFVGVAITSVLRQTFRDFELIVVDDGSTDDSRSVIDSFGTQIKSLYIENLGPARACLRGVSEAVGRYIYILDSDDEMLPNTLERIADELAAAPAKIQFPLVPIDTTGTVIGPPFPIFSLPYTQARMLEEIRRNGSYSSPPTSGNVFRSDIFHLVGDIDYERLIDGITYLICPFVGEVITIPEALARYRIHNRSMSGFANPSSDVFRLEKSRFVKRIDHLQALLPMMSPPRAMDINLSLLPYIHERELMALAYAGRRVPLNLIFRYWYALAHSLTPLRSKLVAAIWAALFILPSRRIRTVLVWWRFNPWARPKLLTWLKSWAVTP
jgi:glycosyltransferase involved in cell wall biosynthesis